MKFNLKRPKCGFGFMASVPDDETDENIDEIKTCPCGGFMEEVDEIPTIFISDD